MVQKEAQAKLIQEIQAQQAAQAQQVAATFIAGTLRVLSVALDKSVCFICSCKRCRRVAVMVDTRLYVMHDLHASCINTLK